MRPRQLLKTMYWTGFLLTMQTALTTYINSSFLETKIPTDFIGLTYTTAAFLAIIGLYGIPRAITAFGSKGVLGTLVFANIVNLIMLGTMQNPWVIAVCFVLFFTFNTLIYLGFDILIEHWSSDSVQGSVRGTYLTSLNVAYVVSPLLAGFVADRLGFDALYGFAMIMILPVMGILMFRLPTIKTTHPSKIHFLTLVRKFINHPMLHRVFTVNFVLQFFYSWMVIYSPIFLHEEIGIPWDTIGILFTIMLTAFVLLQYPIGKLSDKFGEKPFLIAGLFIMGTATLGFSQAATMTIPMIALILFITRVGASMIEVTSESYFFRHVHRDDIGTIGFFRNTFPFAYIVAPIIASLLLKIMPTKFLFIVLGIICLGAILVAKNIRTRR